MILLNRAQIEISCKDPKTVVKSLEPEIEKLDKFNAQISGDKDKIKLSIEANDLSGLLAGINSYMRLIKISVDTKEFGE